MRLGFYTTYIRFQINFGVISQSKTNIIALKFHFSFAGMPQGFNPNPAFKTKDAALIKTKNTEIRENFDNERSIGGIQDPIRGKSTVHDSHGMTHLL